MKIKFGLVLAALCLCWVPVSALAEGGSDYHDPPFPDVSTSNPYYDSIMAMQYNYILAGDELNLFHPHEPVSRAEFAEIMDNTFGFLHLIPRGITYTPSYHFTDTVNHWAKDAIDLAWQRSLINGTSSNTFSPNVGVKREEAATMVWRYLQQHGVQAPPQPVNSPNTDVWAANAVSAIMGYQLYGADVTGTDYHSQTTMTRQEVAQLMWKSVQLMSQNGDTLVYQISNLPRHLVLEGDGSTHVITSGQVHSPYGYTDITFAGDTFTVNVPATNSSTFSWEVYADNHKKTGDQIDWKGNTAKKFVLSDLTELDICLMNVPLNTLYARVTLRKDDTTGKWTVEPDTNYYDSFI